MKHLTRLLLLLCWLPLPAQAQVFNYFGPVAGILKGSTTSGITTAANGTDVASAISCASTQVPFANTTPSLTCSANLTWNNSTLSFTFGGTSAGLVSLGSGAGDALQFTGGNAVTGNGPSTTFLAGDGASTGTTTGGSLTLKAGTGGHAVTAGNGGAVNVTGGGAGTNGNGGAINATGGASSTGATGSAGSIFLAGGTASGTTTGNGGTVSAVASNGSINATTTANGGTIVLTAGSGGNSAATTANGGTITLTGGAAGTTAATANGGTITLKPGTAPSTANAGQVILQTASGTNALVADGFGNVYCSCSTSASAVDGFLYLGASVGAPTGVPGHVTGSYANAVPVRYDTSGSNLWIYNGAWKSAVQAPQTVTFSTGTLGAVSATIAGFKKFVHASTLDNMEASAISFTCSVNPTLTLYECGTSTTCASPTTLASATLTAAGTAFDSSVATTAIAAGDYVAWSLTAGTCTALDVTGTAEAHLN